MTKTYASGETPQIGDVVRRIGAAENVHLSLGDGAALVRMDAGPARSFAVCQLSRA